MTHHPAHIDAVLSRAEVGALLTLGVVLALIAVAACVPPVYAAIVRRGR